MPGSIVPVRDFFCKQAACRQKTQPSSLHLVRFLSGLFRLLNFGFQLSFYPEK